MCGELGNEDTARSVKSISDADLVKRAVRNAVNHDRVPRPRWHVISRSFGLGSTFASELCVIHEIDPDEYMPAIVCEACRESAGRFGGND